MGKVYNRCRIVEVALMLWVSTGRDTKNKDKRCVV